MQQVIVDGQSIKLTPSMLIGQGGEAEVYQISNTEVLKLYKLSTHPDYKGLADEQKAAKERLNTHQQKLPAFPRNLPKNVVSPLQLARNNKGEIIGYTMQFLTGVEALTRYFSPNFRLTTANNTDMLSILRALHKTVTGTHMQGVVIGDFNDLNVLVKGLEPWLVDADSMQFGKFLCKLYTTRFVDPVLCDPKLHSPLLIRPHNTESDWYAFAMMVAMSFLLTDVWGGVYKPKDKSKKIPHNARSLHRIAVWNPEVVYPKPARPFSVLPDELMQYFFDTFEKDKRGEFPLSVLNNMRWTLCSQCGLEHARGVCPNCAVAAPAVKEVIRVRGNVVSTRLFKTLGQILFAASQNNSLQWVVHENHQFNREDGSKILDGEPDSNIRYRITGKKTALAKRNNLMVLTPGERPLPIQVDILAGTTLSIFDANERHLYWVFGGQLKRDGGLLNEAITIGSVLHNQTLFWVGENFGFGFYRAGEVTVGFVFDAERTGINDSVKLPHLRGQLVDSTCTFARERCWFLTTTVESGSVINRAMVINQNGNLEAEAETLEGDGSWLGTIRGKLALGKSLFSATDTGLVKVDVENGVISKTAEFPDTEPFLDDQTYLFPSQNGIYAVSTKEVNLLKMN